MESKDIAFRAGFELTLKQAGIDGLRQDVLSRLAARQLDGQIKSAAEIPQHLHEILAQIGQETQKEARDAFELGVIKKAQDLGLSEKHGRMLLERVRRQVNA